MLGRVALLQLVLWIATAHAFFPWIPSEHASSSSSGKRTAVSRTEPVAYKLGRRVPNRLTPKGEPIKDKVARVAAELAKKHGAGTPTADLQRRGNSFSLLSASTPSATNAAGINQDGTDFSYFVQAEVGSGDQLMYMLLDTGAGATWVMGSDCDSTACGMHDTFTSSNSKTFKSSSDAFSIAYGSGTVAGKLATDSVSLASVSATLSFGVANTTSDDFTHFPFDGILGLSMSKGVTDNFMAAVKSAGSLPANIFGIDLARASDGTNDGEIMFGATNKAKYTGDIGYTSVASSANGDWAIPLDDFGYDGDKAGINDRLAYIDTGTTYIFGPPKDVATLHKQVSGASSDDDGVTYTVPCSTTKSMTVYFSGTSYDILAKDWISEGSDGTCTSVIYGHEVVTGAWFLGDTFLKNVYAVFDVDESRIGFATKADGSTKSSDTVSASSYSSSSSATESSSAASSSSGNGGSQSSATKTADASSSASSGAASGSLSAPASDAGSTTALSAASVTAMPGLGGHVTSASGGETASSLAASATAADATDAADSTSTAAAASSSTSSSPADQLHGNKVISVACIVAAVAMVI